MNASRVLLLLMFLASFATGGMSQTQASSATNPTSTAGSTATAADPVKINFDAKDSAILFVEVAGQVYRVNSVTKAIERVSGEPASPAPEPDKSKPQDKIDMYAYDPGDEPFDYRLVNVPTAKMVPKGTWNLSFTHRFSQPLRPLGESAPGLFGLDSMSSSSFGITYGITDKLYIQGYRSPVCQRNLCRTVELGLGYHITDQTHRSPVGVSVYASVEGDDNFRRAHTYNLQGMLSRQFGKRVYAFFSPAIHIKANADRRFDPDPDDYPTAAAAADAFRMPRHAASFGMGTMVRITPSVAAIFEFTPRVGFKLGKAEPVFNSNFDVTSFRNVSQPEIGYGVQYSVGKHSFSLVFSNTQTTTTSRYNSSNLLLSPKHMVIGFNLFRRW